MIDRFQSFVSGITECYKHIQRIKSTEMTELGLKGTHVMCLFFLHRYPDGLTAAQLCRLCAEDKAAISRTLKTLRRRDYVVADGKKYRAVFTLSAEGAQIAKQLNSLICQWVNVGGDGLTDGERAAFYQTLGHITNNLRVHLDAPV